VIVEYFDVLMILQDDGIEVRSGALGLRQLGIASAHCKLDSFVANFIKVLCGQEIYKYYFCNLLHFYQESFSMCGCSDLGRFFAVTR